MEKPVATAAILYLPSSILYPRFAPIGAVQLECNSRMLQERGELLYGDLRADIAEFLRFSWPLELAKFDEIDVGGESKLIVWFNVEAGSAAASRKDDPADVLTFVPTAEARWQQRDSRRMICSCGSDLHELAAGHQLNEDGADAWIVVGTRCVGCGLLSSPVDWNVE